MGIRRGPSIVKDGLVLCLDAALPKSYPLSGNIWYDISGNGNNGTINGATFDTNSRGVFDFNGSSNYVNCGNLNFSSSFSLSCWMRVDSGTSSIYTKGLVSKYNTNGNYRQYTLGFNESNNYINFGLSTDGTGFGATGSFIQSPNNSIARSTWYHICGVFTSGSKVELFINGELISSLNTIATSHFQSNVKPLEIGSSEASDGITTRIFDGKIAIASLYSKYLLPEEVKQNYEATRGRFESFSPCDIGVIQTTTTTTTTTTSTTTTTIAPTTTVPPITTTTTTTTVPPITTTTTTVPPATTTVPPATTTTTTTTTTVTTLAPGYYCISETDPETSETIQYCAYSNSFNPEWVDGYTGPYATSVECGSNCLGQDVTTTTTTTTTLSSITTSPPGGSL